MRTPRVDWFLVGMIAAVVAAWAFPDPGAEGGILQPVILTKAGVALIFFLHGVALPLAELKAGALRWRLHLAIQACTFIVFPGLGLLLIRAAGRWMEPDLQLGFFFLCALPSTVSSSVALTAAAGGNVAAAVFNATLSSLIGIAITPAWVGWMMRGEGRGLPMGAVVLDLALWLVLPLAIGQLSRPWLGGWAARNKPSIGRVDRGTILLLVYTSFCDSMKWGVWSGHGVSTLLTTLLGTSALFAIVLTLTSRATRAMRLDRGDRIAVIFCGSKKTLASGIPMARLMFAGHPGLGLILLPIMIYHPLQLFVCGILANRWARGTSIES